MIKEKNKEKEYLKYIAQCKLSKNNPFVIFCKENGKELFVISSDNSTDDIKKLDMLTKYKVLYDTAIDLVDKISFSLENAIEDTYSEEILNQFDMFQTTSQTEWNIYYNIENALFRLEALWDILAQIYNVLYALEDDIKNVYHSHIFSSHKKWINKYWVNGKPKEIALISNYCNENDDTNIDDGMWKGNYHYVNSLRNNMTHKFSIAKSYISSYTLSIKDHPAYIIKRTAEVFSVLQDFIREVCTKIIIEESKN